LELRHKSAHPLKSAFSNSRAFDSKCSLIVKDREHLPRADVSYQFKSASGIVKVRITSAGETFKLELNAGKNAMAAQMACTELEKQLTMIALSTK
jgi:hypothetical protein